MKATSMKKLKLSIVVVIIRIALLIVNFQHVQGTIIGMHIFISLWRFEKEVLQATPARQYYEGIAWLHIFEGLQILSEHPEHADKVYALADLTLPHLDALLDGKGDIATITEEQVKAVEAEVNWWMSVASPSFQADMQKVLELYPLNQFIGMTMDDALDYVNSRFAETLEKPDLVDGTDGNWAYYIYKGFYFEYPSSWYVKVREDPYGNLFIIPSTESSKQWNTGLTSFEIMEIWPDPIQPFDLHREIDYVDPKWEQPVMVDGMEGYYFSYDPSKTGLFRKLESILYSEERKIKVRVTVMLFDPNGMFFDFNVNEAKGKYEYLFHITESVKLR